MLLLRTCFPDKFLRYEGDKKNPNSFRGINTISENTVKENYRDFMFYISLISDIKINLIKSAKKPEMFLIFMSSYENPVSWHPCFTRDKYKVLFFIPCLSGRPFTYNQKDKSRKALLLTVLFGKRTTSYWFHFSNVDYYHFFKLLRSPKEVLMERKWHVFHEQRLLNWERRKINLPLYPSSMCGMDCGHWTVNLDVPFIFSLVLALNLVTQSYIPFSDHKASRQT